MSRVRDEQTFALSVWNYALACLANRCSTLSKYCSPPHCWALILSDDPDKQRQGMTALRKDWAWIIAVECSNAPLASELASDLRISLGSAERLLAQRFEATNFHVRNSPAAIELLLQLCGGFAD